MDALFTKVIARYGYKLIEEESSDILVSNKKKRLSNSDTSGWVLGIIGGLMMYFSLPLGLLIIIVSIYFKLKQKGNSIGQEHNSIDIIEIDSECILLQLNSTKTKILISDITEISYFLRLEKSLERNIIRKVLFEDMLQTKKYTGEIIIKLENGDQFILMSLYRTKKNHFEDDLRIISEKIAEKLNG